MISISPFDTISLCIINYIFITGLLMKMEDDITSATFTVNPIFFCIAFLSSLQRLNIKL